MLPQITKSLCATVTGTALLLTSACGISAPSPSQYCQQYPGICGLVGFLIVGGIIASTSGGSSGGSGGYGDGGDGGPGNASDRRLKTDIQQVGVLDNGIKIYTFRYLGQSDGFVGVMADDLLRDPRYQDAVSQGPDGYLRVHYDRLPVVLSNAKAMAEASERVLLRQTNKG